MDYTYGLAWESVDKLGNLFDGDAIGSEDTGADSDTVFSGGSPVEFLHTTVTDEGSVEGGEVVTGDDDGDTRVFFFVVHSGELDVGGVIGDVHEGGVDHLVVDRVLGGSAHSSCSGVKIVDEEATHFTLFDDVGSFTVPLPDQLCWFSGVPTF